MTEGTARGTRRSFLIGAAALMVSPVVVRRPKSEGLTIAKIDRAMMEIESGPKPKFYAYRAGTATPIGVYHLAPGKRIDIPVIPAQAG